MSGRMMERGGFATAAAPAIGARTTYAALALLTLAALALKLFRIDAASYWADELFSVFWVRESLGFLWSAEAFEIETTPPLYYTLLKPWAAAFGSSELAIRSFSAVLSAATIPLVWRLAREFAGPGTALLAAAIFALNPMQMQFAQEARAYALIPPLYSLALLGLVLFCRAAPARRDGALALYGIAALGLVYAHATSAFTLAALNICAGLWLLQARAGWAPLLRLAVVDAAVVVLAIPEIRAILAQAGRYDIAWIEQPDLIGLFNLANTLLVDPIFALRFRIASIVSRRRAGAFRAGAVAGAAGAAGLGLPGRAGGAVPGDDAGVEPVGVPFFIPRIAIFVPVPLAILAAMALVSVRPPVWLRGGFALALVVATTLGLHGILTVTPQIKENRRGLGAALGPQLGARDVVAIGPRTNMLGLGYYLDGLRQERWQPDGAPLIPLAPFAPAGMTEAERVPDARIAEWVRQGKRVWLVLNPRDGELLTQQAMGLVPGQVPRLDRGHAMLTVLMWEGAP